jgi:hypothetical protein
MANSNVNALHGPSSDEEAEKELKRFFPIEQTIAILKPGLSVETKSKRFLDSIKTFTSFKAAPFPVNLYMLHV